MDFGACHPDLSRRNVKFGVRSHCFKMANEAFAMAELCPRGEAATAARVMERWGHNEPHRKAICMVDKTYTDTSRLYFRELFKPAARSSVRDFAANKAQLTEKAVGKSSNGCYIVGAQLRMI